MSEIKVTRKDLFARIAETMNYDTEVVEMCEKYIEQLSRKRPAKVKPEVVEFRANVLDELINAGQPVCNQDMREAYKARYGEEISPQKMSAALRALVKSGDAESHVEGKVTYYCGIREW